MSQSIANIAFPVTFWILILADLIGNILVILIILTNKSLKSPMNYLLLNLAVADIMVGVFLAPGSVLRYFISALPDGDNGQIFCQVLSIEGVTWLGGASSVFSLTAICFERYFAVMYPYSARLRMTSKKVRRIIIICWLFTSALNAPMFGLVSINQHKDKCLEDWPTHPPWLSKASSCLWLAAAGFMPLAIMFVLYSRVIHTLWFKQNQVQGTQLAMLRSRKKVTKLVLIVSVVFFTSWIPTLLLYAILHDKVAFPKRDTNTIGSVMVLFNSSINPFIYAFQSEIFRRHFKKIVSCSKPRNNQVVPPNKIHVTMTRKQANKQTSK